MVVTMAQTLSIFSWTPDNPQGFGEIKVSDNSFDDFQEINLWNDEAKQLLIYIQNCIDNNEYITLRLSQGE